MSKNEVAAEIKKEDKKPQKIFWVIAVCSFIGGVIGAYASGQLEDSVVIENWLAAVHNLFNEISVYIGFISTVLAAMAVIVLYHQSRKAYARWDEEDEEVLAQIEGKLNIAGILANGNLIFTYLFMVVGLGYLLDFDTYGLPGPWRFGIFFTGVVLAIVLTMVGSSKIINFEKEINPEKKGSAYDFNFQKKWLDSSDEAEKLLHYKASFAAYKAVNTACLVLWMICTFGVITWNWDIMAGVMVSIVWLVCYISCNVEALRLSKNVSKMQE